MVLFTHNVKKIKVAAHKNGDVDGTCKQSYKQTSVNEHLWHIHIDKKRIRIPSHNRFQTISIRQQNGLSVAMLLFFSFPYSLLVAN